jgi:hypothetical protein
VQLKVSIGLLSRDKNEFLFERTEAGLSTEENESTAPDRIITDYLSSCISSLKTSNKDNKKIYAEEFCDAAFFLAEKGASHYAATILSIHSDLVPISFASAFTQMAQSAYQSTGSRASKEAMVIPPITIGCKSRSFYERIST